MGALIAVLCIGLIAGLMRTKSWKNPFALLWPQEKKKTEDHWQGEWASTGNESFVIDIWKDKKGLLHIAATMPLEDNEACFWEASARVQGSGGKQLTYYDGTKTIVTYDMDGNENEETIYTGGQGVLTKKEDTLTWDDREEGAADDTEFVYVGEY